VYRSKAEEILMMLRRRPCTAVDIAAGMRTHMNEAAKHLEALINQKKIEQCRIQHKTFYRTRGA